VIKLFLATEKPIGEERRRNPRRTSITICGYFYPEANRAMPIRCPCGCMNSDEASHCNTCPERLVFFKGPVICPNCGNHTSEHAVFCGRCGKDLQGGYARRISSDETDDPSMYEPYVKYGNPYSLFVWGATTWMTKTQYMFRTATYLVIMAILLVVLALIGYPVWGLVMLLITIGGNYLMWRVGRKGVGA